MSPLSHYVSQRTSYGYVDLGSGFYGENGHPLRFRRLKRACPEGQARRLLKKLRRIFRGSEKQSQNILRQGVYLTQNTSQAASVEFVCKMQTNYA